MSADPKPVLHVAHPANASQSAAGGPSHDAPPETDVQRREEAKARKTEARLTEKRELNVLLHAHEISNGQLARWLGVSTTHVERMLSPEHPDVNLAYGDRRVLPVGLQRALAFGEIQRLSATAAGVLPRTERLCRVAREHGDVFRFEGVEAVREIDEAIVELQELRREEVARAVVGGGR